MKRLLFLVLLFFILITGGCTVDDNLCEAVSCDAPVATLRVKLVEKSTNRNLLDEGTSFKLSDLKITSTAYNATLSIKVDSTELNNKYISLLSSGNETFSLQYKNYPPDVIEIRSRLVKSGCCGILEIQDLTLNGTEVCTKCTSVQVIEIKK